MIELPEARTLSAQIAEVMSGKTIHSAVAGYSPHGFAFYTGEAEDYGPRLQGKTIQGVQAFAGQVQVDLGEEALLFNDGTNLRFLSPDAPEPKKHQLYLGFDDGSALYCTIQMYGGIQLVVPEQYDNPYYLVAKEKPSPLDGAFDAAYFDKLFAGSKPTLSAKAFLATEQRIPGLGNGVLQDILFTAGLHPKRKINTLSDAEKQAMFDQVKSTLQAMTQGGGRDTEKDFFGNPGGYHTKLSSKTAKQPCPVCGGEITRQAYLGGNVYFCANCQVV